MFDMKTTQCPLMIIIKERKKNDKEKKENRYNPIIQLLFIIHNINLSSLYLYSLKKSYLILYIL